MDTLRFELLSPTATAPRRAHTTDAGFDLHADEHVVLAPGEHKLVGCGFAMALPEGYAGLVCPRSGLAGKHGVTVLNAPGVIDAGYRGETKVILINHSTVPFEVNVGDRIAQLVITPFIAPAFEVDQVTEDATDRGVRGFGSTGVAAA
jgi:dUTP pyrophosphatase